jgi:hypothetical protein
MCGAIDKSGFTPCVDQEFYFVAVGSKDKAVFHRNIMKEAIVLQLGAEYYEPPHRISGVG